MDIVLNKPTKHVMIIHDHVIRYVKGRGSTLDDLKVVRNRFLPPGTIEGGVIKETETFQAILGELKRQYKMAKGELYITLPNETNLIRRHQVPADVPDDELKGYIFNQLGKELHLPMEDPVFDLCVMGEQNAEKDLLLFITAQEIIDSYLRLFYELKLEPVVLDYAGISLERFLENTGAASVDGHYALVTCYPTAVTVTIFHGEFPLITRTIPTMLDAENWQINGEHSDAITWTGALGELESAWRDNSAEVERLLSFYQYNYRQGEGGVDRVIITGDHPELNRFYHLAAERLEGPEVRMLDVIMDKKGFTIDPHHFEAVGLLMKGEVK